MKVQEKLFSHGPECRKLREENERLKPAYNILQQDVEHMRFLMEEWRQRALILKAELSRLRSETIESKKLIGDYTAIMQRWDGWREYIGGGGKASWPRDAFEALIQSYEEELSRLRGESEMVQVRSLAKETSNI